MRYWHPLSDAAAQRVAAFRPERIVLLPLYPQFSTTTTASSLGAWRKAAAAAGIAAPTRALCCYPQAEGLAEAHAALIEPLLDAATAADSRSPRLLFSAHGLPQSVVARGDPYQWQVEETARRIVARLGRAGLDWTLCYQSKVGPMAWLEPSTVAEIERAGRDRVPVVVVPIAFVSEHSETLVELDVTCRAHAERVGVPAYHRVPAPGTHPSFIAALAALVRGALAAMDAAGAGGRRPRLRRGRAALPGRPQWLPAGGRIMADDLHTWLRALHVIAVIAWMAGMLYLPRLYVYHAGAQPGSELSETLKAMERRLLRAIVNPAMVASFGFGGALLAQPGTVEWSGDIWIYPKLALVALLAAFHGLLARWRRDFAADRNRRSARFYRRANEVPTLAMVGIVVLVIVRPF